MLSDVLTVENTNLNWSWGGGLTLPVWSHIIDGVVAIVVWETLIERLSESLSSIIWVVKWWSGGGLWDSLDHHGDGDVVVVGEILGLVSVLLEDGVEGVVTNNLSERFKSDGFDVIKSVGWRNVESNSFNFIDWDGDVLGELVEILLSLSLGADESGGLWSWMGGSSWLGGIVVSSGLEESDTFVLFSSRLLVVMFVLKGEMMIRTGCSSTYLSFNSGLSRDLEGLSSFGLGRSDKGQCGSGSERFHILLFYKIIQIM